MELPLFGILILFIGSIWADEEITDLKIEERVKRVKRAGEQSENVLGILKNLPKPIRIATVESPPYVHIHGDGSQNGHYSGFIPDLIFELSNRLGFDYKFYIPKDGKYGTPTDPNETQWTGMIGEVMRRNYTGSNIPNAANGADIAAADITITKKRAQAVDFLQPFAHVGITAVIQKPHRKYLAANASAEEEIELFDMNFDIFKPLAVEVWILVTVLMIVVWLFNWLMNLYNPYEYGERYKRNLATEDQAQLFNITGSLWYTFTLLQWQGYDRAPRSVASKILGCVWMGFVTVTLITYIGSFVNYLFWASTVQGTANPLVVPINDLRDLVNRHDGYSYGVMKGGSTYQYLAQVARGAEFTQMKNYWDSDEGKSALVTTNEEGMKKVREEKYAFFMTTPQAMYQTGKKPCDLMKTSIEVGKRSYGMAVPKNFPLKEPLHNEIIELIELGVIDTLENRWFSDHECWNVTIIEKAIAHVSTLYLNQPKRVTIKMFWSPLVMIIVGIIVSLIAAAAEILWYKYRGRYDASNRQRGHQLTNEDDGHI